MKLVSLFRTLTIFIFICLFNTGSAVASKNSISIGSYAIHVVNKKSREGIEYFPSVLIKFDSLAALCFRNCFDRFTYGLGKFYWYYQWEHPSGLFLETHSLFGVLFNGYVFFDIRPEARGVRIQPVIVPTFTLGYKNVGLEASILGPVLALGVKIYF